MKNSILIIISLLIYKSLTGSDFKSDADNNVLLFKIGRSVDKNEIIYEINYDKEGKPNKNEPINIYWMKYTNNKIKEPLTWIQKKYSYGIKYLNFNGQNEEWEFQFVSYDEITFVLKKNKFNNRYKVYIDKNGNDIELKKIFVEIKGGTFWFPYVPKIKVFGIDTNSCELICEVIEP